MDKRCFCAMSLAIGRLRGRIEIVRVKIVRELDKNEFFCDFREKREVADGAVVREYVRVK